MVARPNRLFVRGRFKWIIDISWYKASARGFVEGSKDMAKRGLRVKHIISPTHVRIVGDASELKG